MEATATADCYPGDLADKTRLVQEASPRGQMHCSDGLPQPMASGPAKLLFPAHSCLPPATRCEYNFYSGPGRGPGRTIDNPQS